MNRVKSREFARTVRCAVAVMVGSLLVPACTVSIEQKDALVENADCVDTIDIDAAIANELPGQDMRQDINKDPLFRSATLNIAFEDGYGSGGLFRDADGKLVIRTVRHVLEASTASSMGGVYFPGYGWWSVAGCDVEQLGTDKVGSSDYYGDSVSEVALPDDVAASVELKISEGAIQPLVEFNDASADYFIDRGYQARIAQPATGEYTNLTFVSESETVDDNLLQLRPSADIGSTADICQGRSGQPVQMGDAAENSISDESFGSVSFILLPENAARDVSAKRCSKYVGVIKNTA